MTNLYERLATVYAAMYHTFIDYEEEYKFYSDLLQKQGKYKVLELGCGTGSLAKYFMDGGFKYLGLDYSEKMLELAEQKELGCTFFQGDMRNFVLERPIESMISTGRSVSYLVTNDDVVSTIKSMYQNLQPEGLIAFDFIDANKFLPAIIKQKEVEHKAIYGEETFIRNGIWTLNLKSGMDVNWEAVYYKEEGNGRVELGQDRSTVRTFMKDEIELFLTINGFEILEFIERRSYYFPTYVVVAKKK